MASIGRTSPISQAPPAPAPTSATYTATEAALRLGISVDTLRRKAKSGEIPPALGGRLLRFSRDHIDGLIGGSAGAPPPPRLATYDAVVAELPGLSLPELRKVAIRALEIAGIKEDERARAQEEVRQRGRGRN